MKFSTSNLRAAVALTAGVAFLAACDDDDDMMQPDMPEVTASASTVDFGELDTGFGAGPEMTLTVTNTGDVAVTIGDASIAGTNAADFTINSGGTSMELAAGASMDIAMAFDPSASGGRTATLVVPATDLDDIEVALEGMADEYAYAQVDRMGIPALNTVFNHPPQFSKTDYNVASPAMDAADYTGLFETVLGAVANADPEGTAALLLPDALPVDLSVDVTAFASLTGRALADDATDVALTVVVGPEELHSDNVDANDKAFLATFPYLATPNN